MFGKTQVSCNTTVIPSSSFLYWKSDLNFQQIEDDDTPEELDMAADDVIRVYRKKQTPQLREPQDMTEEERLAMEIMEMFKPKRSLRALPPCLLLPMSNTNVRIFGKDRASTSNSKSNLKLLVKGWAQRRQSEGSECHCAVSEVQGTIGRTFIH